MAGAVHVNERTRATAVANEPWSTRELKAGQVDVALARNAAGMAEARDVVATGNPQVMAVNNGTLARNADKDKGTTVLAANTLSAHLVDSADAKHTPEVDTIAGRGSTLLRQVTADGKEQTVAADSLDAKLRPKAVAGDAKSPQDNVAQSLLSAVQVGHVQMMQREPAKQAKDSSSQAGGDDIEHALADRAVYDGDSDLMTLSGGVQFSDASSVLWASQVSFDHKTGDAHAAGAVKVSYTEEPAAGSTHGPTEPVHVLADRADLVHATGVTAFYGKPVRLWQGGSQILAPVIELSKTQRRLVAHGNAATVAGEMPVRTMLAGGDRTKTASGPAQDACPAASTAKGAAAGRSTAQTAVAVQVTSGGLTYADSTRQADFTGGFRAETADGTIRASEGVVYLQQAPAPQKGTGGAGAAGTPMSSLSGDLDHVVATGRVELDKPGLKATGERLVYTASDRTAVLTGDAKAPPKAVGQDGTTTGEALLLRSSCDGRSGGSVEVLGAPGRLAHTDARVSEEETKGKAK